MCHQIFHNFLQVEERASQFTSASPSSASSFVLVFISNIAHCIITVLLNGSYEAFWEKLAWRISDKKKSNKKTAQIGVIKIWFTSSDYETMETLCAADPTLLWSASETQKHCRLSHWFHNVSLPQSVCKFNLTLYFLRSSWCLRLPMTTWHPSVS